MFFNFSRENYPRKFYAAICSIIGCGKLLSLQKTPPKETALQRRVFYPRLMKLSFLFSSNMVLSS